MWGGYRLRQAKQNGCRIILYFCDSIDWFDEEHKNILFYYIRSRKYVDAVYSFDKSDCEKYHFHYTEQIYGLRRIQTPSTNEYDLYFSGRDKGRFNDLVRLLHHLESSRLKILVRMPEITAEQQAILRSFKHVTYESEMIPYYDCVAEMLKCKCILDLVQSCQAGVSWRVIEAFIYNKRLITNNESVVDNKYFDDRFIKVINDPEEVQEDWLRDDSPIEYNYQNDYSAATFIDSLKKELSE